MAGGAGCANNCPIIVGNQGAWIEAGEAALGSGVVRWSGTIKLFSHNFGRQHRP
jgi:hypothetical protein